jgi:N6-adenosine-specific RNA methylase IME4
MKYNIIYADPPWFEKIQMGRGKVKYYKTMKTRDICSLPIKDLADDNCILFIWVVNPMLQAGLDVIKAWGFEYKTVGFVWIKLNKQIPSLFYGMGNWTRSNAEMCLIGTKGSCKRISKSVHSVIISKLREHSRKPDEARKRIIQLCGDIPRIELFARQKIQGWDTWGNQVPKDTQKIL